MWVCICVTIDHSCLIKINGRMDGFVQANLNQFSDRNPNRYGQMKYSLRVSPGSDNDNRSCKSGATPLSRMNFSAYVGHATIFG